MLIGLAAGSGGHLAQLDLIRRDLRPSHRTYWMTDRTPQSESLLSGERVVWVPHSVPRKLGWVLLNAIHLARSMPRDTNVVISTGAGVAISCALVLLLRGFRPLIYIESATRVTSLSATGRVLQWFPNVRTYAQHEELTNLRWRRRRSVLQGFRTTAKVSGQSHGPLRVLVTVGANQEAGFARMIDAVYALMPASWPVVWQTGPTDVSHLSINARAFMPFDELAREVELADVIVSHAGTGSILTALRAGKMPIVIARDGASAEHVDDHQAQLADHAERMGLVLKRSALDLSLGDFRTAASKTVMFLRS